MEKNRGEFVKYIKYNNLLSKIGTTHEPILIDGVCLLAVCEIINKNPDFLIYIKRVSKNGKWCDEEKCEVTGDIDEFISKVKSKIFKIDKEKLRLFAELSSEIEGTPLESTKSDSIELWEEIIRYHNQYEPHKKANIIFNRLVD